MYYIHDFIKNNVSMIEDKDMPRWLTRNQETVFKDYNLTGKDRNSDTVAYHATWSEGHGQFTYAAELVPGTIKRWLVTDANGRHLTLEDLAKVKARYTPVPIPYHRFLLSGHKYKWRREVCPSLLKRVDLANFNTEDKADVEELAGAHFANKLFYKTSYKSRELFEDLGERRYYGSGRPRCWKNNKASRQWQKNKTCKKKVTRQMPVSVDIDVLMTFGPEDLCNSNDLNSDRKLA